MRDEEPGRDAVLWIPPAGDVHVDVVGDLLTAGVGELEGRVSMDPELLSGRLRLGLINSAKREDDSPVIRFPNWGDACRRT